MIRVTAMYPNVKGKRFNLDYYKNSHINLVKKKLSPHGLIGVELETALAGIGDSQALYQAIGSMIFKTIEDFQFAFANAGNEIFPDVPNYTDIEPVFQISEIQKM